ncbi:hypothetical protein BBJ28_00023143 [Nothophytophthora sp. Chile5]|nr:hypothetical protein BBJ28_00023143 [Nothophytophthora sp. Chile5]
MDSWELSWEALFAQPASSEGQATGPRLGVNYVQASAPFTSIDLPDASALSIDQDLAKYGIAGARAMVSFFQSEPQLVANQHVLELGAGPGAVGLALAASGSGVASLLLTDLAHVVPLTRENARSAGLQHAAIAAMLSGSCRLDVRELCWGEPLDAGIAARPVDVVVASDCLYESTAHSALLSTLLELTDPSRQAPQPTDAAASGRRHGIAFLAYKQRMPA